MFENLTDKLQAVFRRLGKRGILREADVDEVLRGIRLALLEADVHYKVVKDFIGRVRERTVGAEVTKSLSPAQQVTKIVHEELVETGPVSEARRSLALDGCWRYLSPSRYHTTGGIGPSTGTAGPQ